MKLKQLKVGFMYKIKNGLSGCSSVTLIRNGKKNFLVDTGSRGYHKDILKALKKEKLRSWNIDYVILTHTHLDHIWNIGFYKNASFITSAGIIKNKIYWKKLPIKLGKNMEIIKTPGHSKDSCSVIVKTEGGIYAITGDLFFSNQEKVPSFEKNKKEITKQRKKILKIADYVVPGHGKMFKVKKRLR